MEENREDIDEMVEVKEEMEGEEEKEGKGKGNERR